mmetsp:Transcript_4023/g.8507  ORF Transcript_4023/g.8507 Transcript_4023/m.8507 type:complete len:103 (+) Transcript_4023:1192-1500(+)
MYDAKFATLMTVRGVMEVEFGCTQSIHYCVEDSELSCSEGSNHNATWQKSNCAKVDESDLLGNVGETSHHGSISSGTLLVDFGEESVSRVRNNSCGDSSNNT